MRFPERLMTGPDKIWGLMLKSRRKSRIPAFQPLLDHGPDRATFEGPLWSLFSPLPSPLAPCPSLSNIRQNPALALTFLVVVESLHIRKRPRILSRSTSLLGVTTAAAPSSQHQWSTVRLGPRRVRSRMVRPASPMCTPPVPVLRPFFPRPHLPHSITLISPSLPSP
ncbi:hypothetical protein BD779DRAFT_491281 [Infundibulicybe gibba]|nr:hypothetical protein BD779DRAFT_491281 [Infundibulicybe gibba]